VKVILTATDAVECFPSIFVLAHFAFSSTQLGSSALVRPSLTLAAF